MLMRFCTGLSVGKSMRMERAKSVSHDFKSITLDVDCSSLSVVPAFTVMEENTL